MKEVRTLQKYKCDFCRRRGIKSAMERHEKICWRNPNRICPTCENDPRGVLVMNGEDYGGSDYYEPCHFCSQRDKKKEAEIAAWEAQNQKPTPNTLEEKTEVPF